MYAAARVANVFSSTSLWPNLRERYFVRLHALRVGLAGLQRRLYLCAPLRRRDAEVVRKDKAFFVDQRGQRVKRGAVQNSVRASLAKVTSMKKRSPHVLRHTFATAMLNNEAGLESVKKLLGHESLSTTEIYTHTTFEQLKKIYDKAHPRA